MKLTKKVMAMTLAGALSVGALTVGAAQKTENVQRRYENVQVQVDGQKEIPANEPFFIGSTVYVSLRDAGQLVGAQVGWDGKSNTVQIATGSAGASSEELALLQSQLGSKNLQLATANSKIATMEEKIAKYEKQLGISDDKEEDKDDDKDTKIDTDKLENMLQDTYKEKFKVEWSFSVSGDEDNLKVKVQFDSDEDEKDFDKITKSELEKFSKDICKDLQKKVKNVEVEGSIYDKEEKETISKFEMTSKGKFKYDYLKKEEIDSDKLRSLEKRLADNHDDFPNLNFYGQYDGSSINVRDIVLEADDGEITYIVYTDFPDFAKYAWRNLNKSEVETDLEKFMEAIEKDIKQEFDVKMQGYIYDEDEEKLAFYDGDLDLY